MRRILRPRARAGLTAFVALAAISVFTSGASAGVSGAGFTTDDPAGNHFCVHGPNSDQNPADSPAVNCNLYAEKTDVWINGGPTNGNSTLSDGYYFFAVLEPGGQSDPNDDAAHNLSDTNPLGGDNVGGGDPASDRVFHVSGNQIDSYAGPHGQDATYSSTDGLLLQLAPYDTTSNPGGVYILAICSLGSSSTVTTVDPSHCKYDAFKVEEGSVNELTDLAVTKGAVGSFDRRFKWDIKKEVDKTLVKQVGGNVTFNYTITVHHDNGTDEGWKVTGTITVSNLNTFDVTGVDVTDAINDANAICAVTDATDQTIPAAGSSEFAYECDYSHAPANSTETNTATATWDDFGSPTTSADFSFTFTFPSNPADLKDDCVTVTDSFDGADPPNTLGTACVTGDPNPKLFYKSRTVPVPSSGCVDHNNTAVFTTNDSSTTGSASQKVTVCGPLHTGALTMGFWQNKNGQGIIKSYCGGTQGTSLFTFLTGYNPFKDLTSGVCTNEATYVYNVIKAATCSGPASAPCNKMLKAQMLATALDVYFSDPALGGNRIGAPAPIGGVHIDLTKICNMIDGSGGTATCGGTFSNASGLPGYSADMTVLQILAAASGNSAVGGTPWFGTNKAQQVLAKNVFDAINNQVVFGP